jgi:hypothetical protein
MNIEKQELEFLIKRALTHFIAKPYGIPEYAIVNTAKSIADDILVADDVLGKDVKELVPEFADSDYMDKVQKQLFDAMGIPREFIEPKPGSESYWLYNKLLYSLAPDPEELKKLNIKIESTES